MPLEGRLGPQKCSLSYDRLKTVTCQWEGADGRGVGERELCACVYIYMQGRGKGVLLLRVW